MGTDTQVLVEMAQFLTSRITSELSSIPASARDWRPASQSNTINLILRHLHIEAEWHLQCLEDGRPMPTISVLPDQVAIDAIPLDFEASLHALKGSLARFCALLESSSLEHLHSRTSSAYHGAPMFVPPHFLAYHQLLHVSAHLGQIQTLHNLYLKAHGNQGLFPDNPTYPKTSSSNS